MWYLPRLLLLMISKLVPESDPQGENYTLILRITDYVFTPVTSVNIASHLKTLIKEHHECFRDLYPSASIILNMYYMIHLPEWMIKYKFNCIYLSKFSNRFGPLHYWWMTFEAKHSYFNRLTKCL